MSKKGLMAAWIVLFLSLAHNPVRAQSDPFRGATLQWLTFVYAHEWDSALLYGETLGDIAREDFGEGSPQYSLALSGIIGQTYYARNEMDSASAYYARGLDIFKRNQDSKSDIYKEILRESRVVFLRQKEDTIKGPADSILMRKRDSLAYNFQHSAAARRRVGGALNTWMEDTAARGKISRGFSQGMRRMQQMTVTPYYAVDVMKREYQYMVMNGGRICRTKSTVLTGLTWSDGAPGLLIS